MITHSNLQVKISVLQSVPVVFLHCTLHERHPDHHTCICDTFEFLHKWAVCMGLNPADLLEIGIPTLENELIVRYTCCLEYPLPHIDEHAPVNMGELPGGKYAVTRLQKSPNGIGVDIRMLLNSYMEQERIVRDANRPIYEIYHQHSADYCVPVLG